MFTVKALQETLKLRYLLFGGTLIGGMKLHSKYDDWKEEVLDMKLLIDDVMKNAILEKEYFNNSVDDATKQISNVKKLLQFTWYNYKDTINTFKEKGFHKSYEEFIAEAISKRIVQTKATNEDEQIKILEQELRDVQTRYQREIDRLEKENKEIRQQNILLRTRKDKIVLKKTKKSLIEMYSDVLDELAEYKKDGDVTDQLPRIVVVGDQSAGKTSVLEMVAQARIFPRGAGEMMTRSPVKVTLCEGPYHIAQFRDSAREYDLTSESDLAELRKEVEMRMIRSIRGGRTVSQEVISMSVKGPGLPRMILVDLPGVISTQTVGMASDTRESIKHMIKTYMNNPNAIILCIQDGSVDAERSNVTDLVSQCDPSGKRTIFVLTKVDLAEENLANPERIRKILSGKLFPMKALGYFAVVTGRGKKDDSIQTIREYEERFFKNSKLFKSNLIKSNQVTTRNLSLTLSECFWSMVRNSIEQQADAFKASRFNLEAEWKNNYPKRREMDTDELFERGRNEILDLSINLSNKSPLEWDTKLMNGLWNTTIEYVFENIYMPAIVSTSKHTFNTTVDIGLKKWAEDTLPVQSITCAWETLQDELQRLFEESKKQADHDDIFDTMKTVIVNKAKENHMWEGKAKDTLKTLQLNALQDKVVTSEKEWKDAVQFLETSIRNELKRTDHTLSEMMGPTFIQRWLYWSYVSEDQKRRKAVKTELENFLDSEQSVLDEGHSGELSYEEISTVRKNLEGSGWADVTTDYIKDTWIPLHRSYVLKKKLLKALDCRSSFYLYQHKDKREEIQCSDVVLFWRIRQMLKVTSNALRQQITNREVNRLHKELKDILEDFGQDPDKKKELLIGHRVSLANELKHVRQIQEKLEEFINALNKERR